MAVQNHGMAHLPPIVLALGKFESIHIGHRALIETTKKRAYARGVPPAVMLFEPNPIIVLGKTEYKPMFTNAERFFLLKNIGFDKNADKDAGQIIVQNFDLSFAAMCPLDFCRKIFVEFGACEVVIGEGYRFGRGREGTVEILQNEAAKYGSHVFVLDTIKENKMGISTSRIRQLLLANNLQEAQTLLGFPFFVMGEVTRGRQIGRTIGFPTLNIYPDEKKLLPADGVYATQTAINGGKPKKSITNIGFRPTINAVTPNNGNAFKRSVETHILEDAKNELCDEKQKTNIVVEFLKFIRPEQKFESLDELKKQIQVDIKKVDLLTQQLCKKTAKAMLFSFRRGLV